MRILFGFSRLEPSPLALHSQCSNGCRGSMSRNVHLPSGLLNHERENKDREEPAVFQNMEYGENNHRLADDLMECNFEWEQV